MKINQKDIVLLSYPFSNLEDTKVRPALIVSKDSINKNLKDCIMVPLTSVIKADACSVTIGQENLSSGKLLKKSRIKFDKIFSVEKYLIRMKIGTLNDKTFAKIKKKFAICFNY